MIVFEFNLTKILIFKKVNANLKNSNFGIKNTRIGDDFAIFQFCQFPHRKSADPLLPIYTLSSFLPYFLKYHRNKFNFEASTCSDGSLAYAMKIPIGVFPDFSTDTSDLLAFFDEKVKLPST